MKMPNFTAEASLYKTRNHYPLPAVGVQTSDGEAVMPQQYPGNPSVGVQHERVLLASLWIETRSLHKAGRQPIFEPVVRSRCVPRPLRRVL